MRLTRFYPVTLFLALSLTVMFVERLVVRSTSFTQHPDIFSLAVTVDIAIGLPLLYYFLLVRKKYAAKGTLIPVFILSVVAANMILPDKYHSYINYVELLLPVVEFIILVLLILKIRKWRMLFRQAGQTELCFNDKVEIVAREELGDSMPVRLLAAEVSLFYYALTGWFKVFKSRPGTIAFSYHRKKGFSALMGVLLFLVIVETTVMHMAIRLWSPLLAWILTGVSIYSFLWLVGDLQAIRLQPIVLNRDNLFLRTGMRWRVNIPISNIAGIQEGTSLREKNDSYLRMTVYGEPNYTIHLKNAMKVSGLLGMQRDVQQIGIFIDEERKFLKEMNRRRECL